MQYGKILSNSIKLTFAKRKLWWFAIFAASGTGLGYFQYGFQGYPADWQEFENIFFDNLTLIIVLGIVALAISLIWCLLGLIMKAGLFSGSKKAIQGEAITCKAEFNFGLKKFFKTLCLSIVFGLLVLSVLVIFGIPVLLFMAFGNYILVTIIGFIGILLLIVVSILVAMFYHYAFCALYFEDKKVMESFYLGWKIFKENVAPTILMYLIIVGISGLIGFGIIIIVLMIVIPFGLLALIGYGLMGILGAVLLGSFGVVLLVIAMLFFRAVLTTFITLMWAQTFLELNNE